MYNGIGESSQISNLTSKKIESVKELKFQCSGQKDYFVKKMSNVKSRWYQGNKNVFDKSSLDNKDQEERDRSIMVYNVLESSAEINE